MIEQNVHDIAGREKHAQFVAAAEMHRMAKRGNDERQMLFVLGEVCTKERKIGLSEVLFCLKGAMVLSRSLSHTCFSK